MFVFEDQQEQNDFEEKLVEFYENEIIQDIDNLLSISNNQKKNLQKQVFYYEKRIKRMQSQISKMQTSTSKAILQKKILTMKA